MDKQKIELWTMSFRLQTVKFRWGKPDREKKKKKKSTRR